MLAPTPAATPTPALDATGESVGSSESIPAGAVGVMGGMGGDSYRPKLRVRSGGVLVTRVAPGSPADKNGISPGDHIVGMVGGSTVLRVRFAGDIQPSMGPHEQIQPMEQPPIGVLVEKPNATILPAVLTPSLSHDASNAFAGTVQGATVVDEPGVFVDAVLDGRTANPSLRPGDRIVRAQTEDGVWQDVTAQNAEAILVAGDAKPLKIEVRSAGEAEPRLLSIPREPFDFEDAFPPSIEGSEAEALSKKFTVANSIYIMQRNNVSGKPVDDRFSETLHREIFEAFDPKKLYFTQEDIRELQGKVHRLDDDLEHGDASFAHAVQSKLEIRAKERTRWTKARLARPMDFSKPVKIEGDRPEFPRNDEEARSRWDNEIKLQVMKHVATGASEKEAKELVQRYTSEAERGATRLRNRADEIFLHTAGQTFDPHTGYMSRSGAERFSRDSERPEQEVTGVHFERLSPGLFQVSEVVPQSAAARAGVRVGDVVVGVGRTDGSVTRPTANEFSGAWSKDVPADKLTLKLRRPGTSSLQAPELLDVSMPRDYANARASGSLVNTPDGKKIGVIRIPSFYSNRESVSVSKDVQALLDRPDWADTDGLLLDLRNNRGGDMREAATLSSLLGVEGVIYTSRGRSGTDPVAQRRGEKTYERPVTVVVSRGTASASEAFVGAFKDYGRGVVVGDTTFGKGSHYGVVGVSGPFSSPGTDPRGAVATTTHEFFGPDGRSPQKVGLRPDVAFPTMIGMTSQSVGEEHLEFVLPAMASSPSPHPIFRERSVIGATAKTIESRIAARRRADPVGQELAASLKAFGDLEKDRQRQRMVTLPQLKAEMDRKRTLRARLNALGASGPGPVSTFGQDPYSRELLNIASDQIQLEAMGPRRPHP
ncbi:MAG: PDZ domain-containing protein [Deltaproteobacteria bacterium]|nr:PDZ domain-containing protein [Deltaproteobacteria bacterium]